MKFSAIIVLSAAALASARFVPIRRAAFTLQNGKDAVAQEAANAALNANSPCTAGTNACITGQFAQCVGGKFVLQPCGPGTVCHVLPLDNAPGTSPTCTTDADFNARIAASGASGAAAAPPAAAPPPPPPANNAGKGAAAANTTAAASGGDPQSSLTLDPAVIATGFENDGQSQPEEGQVASLTSSNNFINFCLTTKLPITNGQQIKTGSCNPAPMGVIAATTNMPSAKFVFPLNGQEIEESTPFTVQLAINNLETGNFVNANENYFSAPQQTDPATGNIKGHSHIVIEKLTSLSQTKPLDPTKFDFFKGLNGKAQGGILSADVTAGLAAGSYRISTINSAANHQPVLVAVAQHGNLDDVIYFTVKKGANPKTSFDTLTAAAPAAPAAAAANATAAAPAASKAAAKKGKN
ncbi:hypothetical protein BDW22DRAFT_1128093 [Trametopsis cervina]|nr:hypothetical protein BDW22DRAFT_1128093 [Trametopsis cervina]